MFDRLFSVWSHLDNTVINVFFLYNIQFTLVYRFPLEKTLEWCFWVQVWNLTWFLLHVQAYYFSVHFFKFKTNLSKYRVLYLIFFIQFVMAKFLKNHIFIFAMDLSISLAFSVVLDYFLRADLHEYNYLNKWYDKSYSLLSITLQKNCAYRWPWTIYGSTNLTTYSRALRVIILKDFAIVIIEKTYLNFVLI